MRKNFLLIEHGGDSKAFTLETLRSLDLNIFIATSTVPEWLREYIPAENIIETDTYNSVKLLADVVAFSAANKINFNALGTFFEHTVTQAADIASALDLPFISSGAARRSSSNKLLMRQVLKSAGVSTPRFAVISKLDENTLVSAINEVGVPCVLKPVFGSQSYGVMKIDEGYNVGTVLSEIGQNISRDMKEVFKNFAGIFMVEEYLSGPVISIDGIVANKEIFIAGSVEFIMGPEPHFTQEANYIPARIDADTRILAENMAKDVVHALGFDQCGFHAEMRLTPEGPRLIEIAARLPGGPLQPGYERATGVNLTRELIKVWLGEKPDMASIQSKVIAQKAIFPRNTGVIAKLEFNNIHESEGVFAFASIAASGEKVITYPSIPKPFYYYAVEGKDFTELHERELAAEARVDIVIE